MLFNHCVTETPGVGNFLRANGIWHVKYLFVAVVILKINRNRGALKSFERCTQMFTVFDLARADSAKVANKLRKLATLNCVAVFSSARSHWLN